MIFDDLRPDSSEGSLVVIQYNRFVCIRYKKNTLFSAGGIVDQDGRSSIGSPWVTVYEASDACRGH